jgi:ATP-dependent Clp protease ATP-binding subunit ClpB
MLKDEVATVLELESHLGKRIIGQAHALAGISQRIRTSRAGMDDPSKPIGVFLLVGPSGVGKTETALALSDLLYGGERNLISINMSEFQEAHTVSTLKGSPPGYVGYGEGGVLTEAVRRRPYSVVLLDEVEKAHPDVWNIMLQIFDDGRLTDGKGRTVDFKNTVIIMTSNVAAGTGEENVREMLRAHFKPEFLNRIDDIITFKSLGKDELGKIIEIQLALLRKFLADRRITLELTPAARDAVFQEGYDPAFGARPLKRAIQKLLADPLAMKLLDGEIQPGEHVIANVNKQGEFSFKAAAAAAS